MERCLLPFAIYSKTGLRTAKMHALRHENITELGALVGASANVPESQHKQFAKDPYRHSNKQSKLFATQIVRICPPMYIYARPCMCVRSYGRPYIRRAIAPRSSGTDLDVQVASTARSIAMTQQRTKDSRTPLGVPRKGSPAAVQIRLQGLLRPVLGGADNSTYTGGLFKFVRPSDGEIYPITVHFFSSTSHMLDDGHANIVKNRAIDMYAWLPPGMFMVARL